MATSTFSKFWSSADLKILDYSLPAGGSVALARTNASQYMNFLLASYKNTDGGAAAFTLWWGYISSGNVLDISRIDTNTSTPYITVTEGSGQFTIANTSSVGVGLRVFILGGGNLRFNPVTT